MILAAGLGTRLRPLTDDRPKALVEINGRTLLEITLARLQSFGIREVIVNVHHFADMIADYLRTHDNFGMRIEISREDVLLDTGGGLKQAGWFFLEGGEESFVVHNVDVIGTIDIERMVTVHNDSGALATLAVQERETSRYLLFDQKLQLCGRQSREGNPEVVRPAASLQPLAFCGIHVISRRIFSLLTEEGEFPIVPAYLRLASQGEKIMGFRADEYSWRDLGRLESVRQVNEEYKKGVVEPGS